QEAEPAAKAEAKPQESPLATERKELAALRLLVVADRKFAEAKERLVQLERSLEGSSADGAPALRRDVRALLDEVRTALGENVASANERIDDAARRAIAENDYAFITVIGAAAVPALMEAVRATPDFLPSDSRIDPFSYLLSIDPVAASELCDELGVHQGLFWKRRVLRALKQGEAFAQAVESSRGRVPGLLRELERLMTDPAVRAEAFPLMKELVGGPHLTAKLEEVFLSALGSEDAATRDAAWRGSQNWPQWVTLYRKLIASPVQEVRLAAVERLALLKEESPEFLALSTDPSPAIRAAVASRISQGLKEWTPLAVQALDRLLADDGEVVRTMARRTFDNKCYPLRTRQVLEGFHREEFVHPLSVGAWSRMVESSDVEERRTFVYRVLAFLPAREAVAPAEILVRDGDGIVATGALTALGNDWPEAPEAYLRLAEAALSNPALDRASVLRKVAGIIDSMVWWEQTRVAAMRWALGRAEIELARACVLDFEPFSYASLPPDLARRYCERFFEFDAGSVGRFLGEKAGRFDDDQIRALIDLAADERQPIGLRLMATKPALTREPLEARLADTILRVFSSPEWKCPDWGRSMQEVLTRMPGPLRNEAILALVRVEGIPAALLQEPLREIEPPARNAGEVLRAILETQFESSGSSERENVRQALMVMART
ncbi:MAG: hypothetical protein ABL998_21885, partial [Planctomycetota bacterium]